MRVWLRTEKKSMSFPREDILFLYDWVDVFGQKRRCEDRRHIADGCCNFTFAKVKNNMKNTFVKVIFCVSLHFEKVNQYDARGLSTA